MGGFRGRVVAALVAVSVVLALTLGLASASASAGRRSGAIRVNQPVLTLAGHLGKVTGRVPRSVQAAQVMLQRQRPPHKAWKTIATASAKHGKFAFSVRTPRMTGALKLRVIAGPANRPSAKSGVFALPVTQTQVLRARNVVSAPAPGHGGKLVYDGTARPAKGGFIAVGVGKATPDGLLVRVISVAGSRRHWVVTVKPASVFDAVPVGNVNLTLPTEGVTRAGRRPAFRSHFNLTCSASASAQADGSASLSIKPKLSMDWSWNWFPPHPVLDSASFSITATGSVQASASLTGSGSCSFDQELFKHDFAPFDVQIGPVPVIIVPELLTTLTADADASASVSTSVGASVSATGGLKYRGGKVSPIESFTKTFTFQPPSPQGKGSIGARLVPAGRLLLYGIAGPEVDLSGGPQFDLDTTSAGLWRLHVPVGLSAQLVVPDTSLHLGPLNIFSADFTLAQGNSGVTVTNPGDQSGAAGAPVSLQIHANAADGGHLTYTASGLPAGLSIDPKSGLISGSATTPGTSHVTVTATDETGPSGSASFNWTISASTSGSCESSASVFAMTTGKNVVAYVPKGDWGATATGVSVVNVEGSSITPALISTPNVVNAAASNPVTGETVATANNTDIYLLNGSTLSNTLTSGGSGALSFSGGSPTDSGVAMDPNHNRAVIGLSIGGTPGFQFLDLSSSTLGAPIVSPDAAISENFLLDPFRNLLISASEDGNFEIANVSNPANPVFYDNQTNGGELDSTGEDCSTGIVVAPAEEADPSSVFVADLSRATLTPGSPSGTWTAPSQMQTLSESSLSAGSSAVAIAQGTHTGALAGEFGGNEITAFTLPATSGSGTPAITDWVSCGIDNTPDSSAWSEGNDPHTMTAYQSPNSGDAIGLFGNDGATWLARVDLTQLLNPAIVPRDSGGHACASGTIPSSAESFIPVP